MFTVTADQVAADMTAETIRAILDQFSVHVDGRSPLDLLGAFVAGRNPMTGKAMLETGGRYLVLPGAIASEEIRRTCEPVLKRSSLWSSYDRQRSRGAEDLAAETIARLVSGQGTVWTQLKYRAPSKTNPQLDLSATSTSSGGGDLVESDLLHVVDGVALCVEVKAGDLRPRTRQGGIDQLDGDLAKTVKEAAEQADRLRQLLTTHHGLWLENGIWMDLSTVREVHSIAICLDDFGPAVLLTEQLVRNGTLTQTQLPWVISLHDLLVCADVLDPAPFLTYLRRRTSRDAALWVTGVDELDILMWFIAGGFYFEPDPDRLYADRPEGRRPTAKDRRRYVEQGRTVVGTFTDDLDAWYYGQEGSSSRAAPRPRRTMNSLLRLLSDGLRGTGAPGWWRIGADLDNLADQAQHRLVDAMRLTISRTRADGQFHSNATGGRGDTGAWLLIVAAAGNTSHTRTHLRDYLTAKKHQEGADRALGVLLNPDGSPLLSLWDDHPPGPDPELDRLARQMKLVPPDRMPRVLPPHVRHPRPPHRQTGRRRRA